MTILKEMNELDWVDVCALDDVTPNTGVGALIEHQQIAIFRVGAEKRVYALSNQDPFSQAFVMSRGIIGDLQGERVVRPRFINSILAWRQDVVWKIKIRNCWFFQAKLKMGECGLVRRHKKPTSPTQVLLRKK